LVYQAFDGIARSAESKGIRVKITVPKKLMLSVQKNRMERVFTNLMNNSLEAVPEGRLARDRSNPGKEQRSPAN
jgi:ribonuclease P protein component